VTDLPDGAEPSEPVDAVLVDAERPTRFWLWVGVATGVGLVVRVLWVAWGHKQPWTDHGFATYDPARYLQYAEQIGKGHGYTSPFRIRHGQVGGPPTPGDPTSYYPPGYPWFLGIIDWWCRHLGLKHQVVLVAELVQAVLGAATAALGALVARRLVGAQAGIVAAFALALYPNLVFHTGTLLGETLYDFLFLAFLAILCCRPPAGLTARWVALAGVPFALAIMVRPISLALLPLLLVIWWRELGEWRVPLRHLGVLVLVVLAAVVPWTIRNQVRMHALVPLSTNTGDNLCIGHSAAANGKFTVRVVDDPCQVDEGVQYGAASEVRADKEKRTIAIDAIKHDPGREGWLLWRRVYFTFIRDGDHDGVLAAESYRRDRWISYGTETKLMYLADVAYWVTCAVGVTGLVLLVLRRRPDAWLLLSSAVVTAVVPLAFFGDSRFKVPVMPLLLVAAGCAPSLLRRSGDLAAT
jgi:hypothetical protein